MLPGVKGLKVASDNGTITDADSDHDADEQNGGGDQGNEPQDDGDGGNHHLCSPSA